MVVAIVCGLIAGIVSFLPLVGGMRLAKNATPTSNFGHAGALMLGVLVSFVVLAAAAVVCIMAARDLAVPFVLAEAGGIVAFAIGFGVRRMIMK